MFNRININTSTTEGVLTTRLEIGNTNPMVIETPLKEDIDTVKHLDSIKELLELVVNKHLR